MADHPYAAAEALGTFASVKDTPPREPPNGIYHERQDFAASEDLNTLVGKVLDALAKANDPARGYEPHVYVRGGRLVQVQIDEDQRPSIALVQHAGLRREIARVAGLIKSRGVAAAYPPDAVVGAVLEAPHYDGVPALKGITEVAVLRADGSVLDKEGYDAKTHLLYRKVPGAAAVPKVAEQPTDDDVARELRLVWDAIGQFPYAGLADRANALGLLLTPVLRAAIDGQVPLALIDEPRAGTGKRLLTEGIVTITVGHSRGTMTEAESDAEWRKKITTTLLAGHPFNVIDNVTRMLESGALSSALTSRIWNDRMLGKNREVSVASNGIWVATGNNIRVGGDLPRRTFRIRLDAKMARPWTRSDFAHSDLMAWIGEQRADLVHALLTLARASLVRDLPLPATVPVIGGFEEWRRIVGRAVLLDPSAGPHFLGNVEEVWESEYTEATEWEALLSSWYERFEDEPVTAKDVHAEVRYDRTMDRRPNPALYEALPAVLAEGVDKAAFGTKLGTALNQHRDTRFGAEEYRLERLEKDPRTHVVRWRVVTGNGRERQHDEARP